jgi:HAD superfamily hydrolase (TIGR01549 family)
MREDEGVDFKAVLFDKDGVLLDSVDTCFDAVNGMLRHYGRPEVTRDFFMRELWGRKSGTIFEDEENLSTAEKRDRVEYYNQLRDQRDDKTRAYPRATEVLRSLKESGKLKIGLVTSTEKSTAIRILKRFSWTSYFDVVVGGDEVEPKPSPRPILLACEKLGTLPSEALYVGDTTSDIAAGKSAGCITAIITTSMTFEELSAVEGITPIRDLGEVLRLVGICTSN